MAVIVQKYGGATLSNPSKIKKLAEKVAHLHSAGHQVVIVVSAMGQTTNSLIALANQITTKPPRRELDMLLSTGERISMALMSMALNDLGCPAISFTGSQAGVLTNSSHSGAFIVDVKAHRVQEALNAKQVVVLAGFQGVSPQTKEITTLGRGGTDTTAVAIAAFLKAQHCEILKDVPSIFSADPGLVTTAKPLAELTYEELMDMTFWGAKVVHFRSAELAHTLNVPLYVGPAHDQLIKIDSKKSHNGTYVLKERTMFESPRILSLNSHSEVLKIEISENSMEAAFKKFENQLDKAEIPYPQILDIICDSGKTIFWATGPSELVQSMKGAFTCELYSTVTATCVGAVSAELTKTILAQLEHHRLNIKQLRTSAKSISLLLKPEDRIAALQYLHQLVV